MVQRDRDLNQSLHELLLRLGRGAPNVFERLVGLKKSGTVEQFDSLPILLEIHATLWHKAA
jgi:hypothetical protein